MVAFLLVASLVLGVLLLRLDTGRAFAMTGGVMGVALVQVVHLFRTREVGFSLRRSVPPGHPSRRR